jgi:hypothetical protein
LFNSLQTEWETQHSFIKDRRHGQENFEANSLWVCADTPLENCTQPRCSV